MVAKHLVAAAVLAAFWPMAAMAGDADTKALNTQVQTRNCRGRLGGGGDRT